MTRASLDRRLRGIIKELYEGSRDIAIAKLERLRADLKRTQASLGDQLRADLTVLVEHLRARAEAHESTVIEGPECYPEGLRYAADELAARLEP